MLNALRQMHRGRLYEPLGSIATPFFFANSGLHGLSISTVENGKMQNMFQSVKDTESEPIRLIQPILKSLLFAT